MVHNMKYFSFWGLIALTSCFSCGPIATVIHEECTTAKPYEFEIPVVTEPTDAQLSVGDTVSLNFSFSSKIKDKIDGKIYDLKDFKDFYPAIRFYHIEDSIRNPYFFEFSDTCCIKGQNVFVDHYLPDKDRRKDAGIGFDFIYESDKDIFVSKVSFILKKKGIYYFKISSESKADLTGPFPGKCNTRLVYFNFKQSTDGNFDLVKNFIYPNGLPEIIDDFGRGQFITDGGYAFEVK